MTARRYFFSMIFFLVCGAVGGFSGGLFVGYDWAVREMNTAIRNAQPAPTTPTLPDEIDSRSRKGQMKVRLEGREFNFTRYSRVDQAHGDREWNSMACVDTGRGMTVKGRWDADQWWVSAHDEKHQFPSSIEVPVNDLPFSSVAKK